MAFTDNCDLFGSIHEDGVNRFARHLMLQRPSLFNYGTALVANNPRLYCTDIDVAPAVNQKGNPHMHIEDPLPILFTGGRIGMNFCFQIKDLEIDFYPLKTIQLPPKLTPPLEEWRCAIHGIIYGGLGCPSRSDLHERPTDSYAYDKWTITPAGGKLACFKLELFVVGDVGLSGDQGNEELQVSVDQVAIERVEPDGLNKGLECYIHSLVHFAILPRTRVAVSKIMLDILKPVSILNNRIVLKPTPASVVKDNPVIEDNQLKVFVDVVEV